jgi:hypothetical protein
MSEQGGDGWSKNIDEDRLKIVVFILSNKNWEEK